MCDHYALKGLSAATIDSLFSCCAGDAPPSSNDQAGPSKATSTSNTRAGPSSAPDRSSQPYALRHGVASFAGHGWVSLRDDRIRVYGRRIQREVEFHVWEFMRNLAHHHPDADIDIDFDERAVVVWGGALQKCRRSTPSSRRFSSGSNFNS